MRPIVEAAKHDALVCQEAGVDAILFCNEGDLPYRVEVTMEQATAMAAVIGVAARAGRAKRDGPKRS